MLLQKYNIVVCFFNFCSVHGNRLGDDGIKQLVNGILSKESLISEKDNAWWSTSVSFNDTRADEMDRRIRLEELGLGNMGMTDTGMQDVSKLLEEDSSLTTLNLNGNKNITIAGWRRLAKALKENRTLQTLSLDFNKIGNNGISVLAAGLRDNEMLKHLDLEDVGLTEEGGKSLLNLLKCNTTILDVTASPGNAISQELLEDMRRYLALNNAVAH